MIDGNGIGTNYLWGHWNISEENGNKIAGNVKTDKVWNSRENIIVKIS